MTRDWRDADAGLEAHDDGCRFVARELLPEMYPGCAVSVEYESPAGSRYIDVRAKVGERSVGVEVKITRETAGEILRQIRLYDRLAPVNEWVIATKWEPSEGTIEILRSFAKVVAVVHLGERFEDFRLPKQTGLEEEVVGAIRSGARTYQQILRLVPGRKMLITETIERLLRSGVIVGPPFRLVKVA